jgi:hypothetical protein
MIPVGADFPAAEIVIRFIFGKHIREDKTIRRQAFIPPRNLKYSVTKKANLPEEKIWELGQDARGERVDSLKGRADIASCVFTQNALTIHDQPTPTNDHHANVVGWPSDDQAQRDLADILAEQAGICGVLCPQR